MPTTSFRPPFNASAALAVIAGTVCYANSLGNGFVFDDSAYIVHPVIRQFLLVDAFLQPWLQLDLYRPLTLISLALDYFLYQTDPLGFHLTNVLLHGANCLVFYLIARRLLSAPGAALLAALFYAVHPLQSDVVNWVSARGDLLMALTLGLAFWCHLQSRPPDSSPLWRWGAWFLYGASLLAKETGIVLSGLVLCHDLLLERPHHLAKESLSRFALNWFKRYWGYLAVLLILLSLRAYVVGSASGGPASANLLAPLDPAQRFFTMGAIFLRYLYLIVVPLDLCADYSPASIASVTSPFDPGFLAGLACAVLLLYLPWRGGPLVRFLAVFFWLALLPTTNLFFLAPSAMAERYLYLAIQPLSLAFGLAVQTWGHQPRLPQLQTIGKGLVILLLLAYGARTNARNTDWHSDYTLFSAVLEHYPRNARAHENLAHALYRDGSPKEALAHYKSAIAINPTTVRLHFNLGLFYSAQQRPAEAAQAFQTALALNPEHTKSHYNLGLLYQKSGHPDKALPHYRQALQQDPHHIRAAYNLARASERTGRPKEALALYQQVIAADSTAPQALQALHHIRRLNSEGGQSETQAPY